MVTLLFGLFGLIPAVVQTSHAKIDGYSTNKYWTAFWITIVVQIVAVVAFFALVAISLR